MVRRTTSGTPPRRPKRESAAPTLSSEDRALFLAATEGARPLDSSGRVEIAAQSPPPWPRQRVLDEVRVLAESRSGAMSIEDLLDLESESTFQRPGLSRRVLTDLRRGRWVIQSELDLHGYDRESAREALSAFITRAVSRGDRCVRIIHGKGLSSPGGVSVLKALCRQWLVRCAAVLAFCRASPHDGGDGALLALLRSSRGR